ncbi:MAG: flagellar motor stator protein MotA [Betaproteobacteria bacterium]|nr:flagellar motor stator protein MotA [Betaproteobacteria bacterium]
MVIPIGIVIGFGCALAGYVLHGGNPVVLWQPTEMLTIFGLAIGATISSNNSRTIKLMMSEIFKKYPAVLENHHLVEFLTDYLRMMLGGSLNLVQLEGLMEQELEEFVKTEHLAVHAVDNMAQGLPAFGIVAAVMGVVQTMGSIGLPPAELGKLIGAALVGTFLGILFSYAVVAPMAAAMAQRGELEIKSLFAVKAILLASLNGFTPPQACEFGRKIMFPDQRPTFKEFDEKAKEVKGK